ncbi:Hypothetical protein D9617_24g015970 [Elsinoe fawcettii]|nr:Hypothetical protein D9617_24g015970 [Elsinoe fawcettii]
MDRQKSFCMLQRVIKNSKDTSLYTCGGSIDSSILLTPLTLRYDIADPDAVKKLAFPVDDKGLETLIEHCQPATFGYQGKDVLDTSYRQAIKMDSQAFSININPHDLGCMKAIVQLLRPSTVSGIHQQPKVELYKLNVYSGPSGRFKAHVDTPRSIKQFGSLVICLPSPHKGGNLVVRHKGQETTFDWAENSGNAIQWAAFYSDCEHEVEEVTSGHRVTLTYNLYDEHHPGEEKSSLMQIERLSLLDPIQEAVRGILKANEDYVFPHGLSIGIFLSHAYAHTDKTARLDLPHTSLKGIDHALYTVFKHLGFTVRIRPKLDVSKIEWEECKELPENDGGECDYVMCSDYIGEKFHSLKLADFMVEGSGGGDEMEMFNGYYPHTKEKGIQWLNRPTHNEIALGFVRYGNEASFDCVYSFATMIVDLIPPDASYHNGDVIDETEDGAEGHDKTDD